MARARIRARIRVRVRVRVRVSRARDLIIDIFRRALLQQVGKQ